MLPLFVHWNVNPLAFTLTIPWYVNVMLFAYAILIYLVATRKKNKGTVRTKVTLTEEQKKEKGTLKPECVDDWYWTESEDQSYRWLMWVLFGVLVFARIVYCFVLHKIPGSQFLNPINTTPEVTAFAIHWYSLGFLLAFIMGYYIMAWMFKKEYISANRLQDLMIYLFIAILVGARVGHCVFYDRDIFFSNSFNIASIILPIDSNGQFVGFAGLASHGAVIGVIVAMWLFWRKFKMSPWWLLDRLVIVIALGGAFVRIGNLFNSEIYGVETTLPWGFIFERNGETVAKHPTGLYEAICYLIIFGVSMGYYCKKKGQFKSGTILGWWLVALFGARFMIEFLKTNGVVEGSNLLLGQWLSIPCIIGGLVVAWLARREKLPQGPFPLKKKTKQQ
ncbi:MAG: prolipoprotein diacylglyceryl transferase [Bacteroidales bacterium]|nr:prolipoprotein diacylglyceryl transferase [Bacteroidales bacterium]